MANLTNTTVLGLFEAGAGVGQGTQGIAVKAFVLNIAVGLGLFVFEVSGFLLLKSAAIGRRIYQPKTYLVQERLRVEPIPTSPIAWLRRIVAISDDELRVKCGLDGYFFIRLIRALWLIFVPLMVVIVTVLLPINYSGGRGNNVYLSGGHNETYNVTGLDTLAWQNVAPTQTRRYWAHLVCAVGAVAWTLYRIYCEKVHFIAVRQQFLTAPAQRLKASARTVLVTNIPAEYRSKDALEALYDVFVDNDDRRRLIVWVNRDYSTLRAATRKRVSLRHALEKAELKLLRAHRGNGSNEAKEEAVTDRENGSNETKEPTTDRGDGSKEEAIIDRENGSNEAKEPTTDRGNRSKEEATIDYGNESKEEAITDRGNGSNEAKEATTDRENGSINTTPAETDGNEAKDAMADILKVTLETDESGHTLEDADAMCDPHDIQTDPRKAEADIDAAYDADCRAHGIDADRATSIPRLRAEIARLTVQIEGMLRNLDDDTQFPRQNSAFIQFDRQMAAQMACALVSHHRNGRMAPRFLGVAPHEIIWPNMGVTSLGRLVRTAVALLLFVAMLFLWGLPTAFLAILTQLDSLRVTTPWLHWLQPWPSWVISLISGPLASILLALLVQLVVPALLRKLAVLVGAPTRSKRELITQDLYFTFLFVELVLVTSISSLFTIIPTILANPVNIPGILADNLPKAANHFFNYLIIQSLGFSGSVLFQYLRLLYITTIWPWFTQTPREEAWLQATIPHQMWANVYALTVNFAVIGLIYSIIAPLMLVFVAMTFSLFWIAYRHNYYYVQRNKIDTHGQLFNSALSQLFAGVYVMEICLVGLFFLVRDDGGNVVCTPQAVIMIVVLALTAVFHFVLEQNLSPLYEQLPVTLEDAAVAAEAKRNEVKLSEARPNEAETKGEAETNGEKGEAEANSTASGLRRRHIHSRLSAVFSPATAAFPPTTSGTASGAASDHPRSMSITAANARRALRHVAPSGVTPRVADQLAAAIASYPDELADLTPAERDAELRAAFQDPVTREPPPVVWLPLDRHGRADRIVAAVHARWGPYLQYSTAGAFLTPRNKCQVTQPAPDVRPDWLLDWVL